MHSRKENTATIICIIVIVICIVAFFAINSQNRVNSSFKFNEHLDETIVSIDINDKTHNLSLQELSYYILVMESNVNHTAALYNPDNMYSYWNLYISNTFVKSEAKTVCMDMFIRDNIYYLEALNSGFTLDNEEIKTTQDEAAFIYSNLTGKQVYSTELDMEDLYNIRYKINLATKYITHLMENQNLSKDDLNKEGEYYTKIYNKYKINIESIWDNIELGDITITIE